MEAPMLRLWASTRVSPRPISPDEEHVAPGLERMHQTAECYPSGPWDGRI